MAESASGSTQGDAIPVKAFAWRYISARLVKFPHSGGRLPAQQANSHTDPATEVLQPVRAVEPGFACKSATITEYGSLMTLRQAMIMLDRCAASLSK